MVDRMPRYGTVDREYGKRLAFCDPAEDGPVHMLNLMKYKGEAEYGDAGEKGVTGREADDRYAPVDVLAEIGAVITFTAEVLEASEDWDRVAVVKYPTRKAFIDMQSRRDFQDKHVHKEAGMDHTIVMGTLPTGELPGRTKPGRVLLEVWSGDRPAGDGAEFRVEGTIVGDGRRWDGARYRVVADDEVVDLTPSDTHQRLLLQPMIERWA
jgi:hypothetical protein